MTNKKFNYFEGYPAQVNDLIMLTNKPNINVMEIGFNCAEIFLQNNKELTLTSFDLGLVNHSKKYIDATYPNRHNLILGDSRQTIPIYLQIKKDIKFDIIFIGDCHTYETAKSIMENCFQLAHKDTIVILNVFTEDLQEVGPTTTWTEHLQQNKIVELSRREYQNRRGMYWGKYVL
jgi:hypothetical protein